MSMVRNDTLSDPFSVYDGAQAVLDDDTLPTNAKLKVLSAMEMDLSSRQVADNENMAGGEELSRQYCAVRAAILKIDPGEEAHGEVEREYRTELRDQGPELTGEQARQAEIVLRTRRQRQLFLTIAGIGMAGFVLVAWLAAG